MDVVETETIAILLLIKSVSEYIASDESHW